MEELKTIYRNAVPGRIAELERALAAGDVTELRSIAHSLRGSGATYGFPTVTTAAAAVEDAPDDVITPRVHELIGVLREIIASPAELSVAMRVLLVDDDPEIRVLVKHILDHAGYVVIEAASAAEAAAALTDRVPDVVLMDVMLGAEDGVDAAAALFRSIAGTLPRLIFLTGAVRAEQFERMNAAGAAGIIHKPFDPDSFLSLFERLLSIEH